MIFKLKPDIQKARALIEVAKITLARLNEIDIYRYPTNTLTDYYDIVHKLMESLTISGGIKFKGEGAHQELIDYVCKNNNFNEVDRIFLHEIRDFRNRISYEGFMINKDYIELNIERIKKIIKNLSEILNVKIV